MFTTQQLQQEQQLAELDRLFHKTVQWADASPASEPFLRAKSLIHRLLPQLKNAQVKLNSVLVVGLVGGTGTGKSTLVNALVGQEVCVASNVQRPTTIAPQVICRENVDLSTLQLDDPQYNVHQLNSPILEQMILIDCPDPDTQPSDSQQSENHNRDLLQKILPLCDVMIHVGSQQKYKTLSVSEELLKHAPGRRIVFVQSQASRDDDIRADWRVHLESLGFEVPTIYRIDGLDEFTAKSANRPFGAEFTGLVNLLQDELANRARLRIKRANILDLYDWLFSQVDELIDFSEPALEKLRQALDQQNKELAKTLRNSLSEHLKTKRHWWRSRLMDQILESWGGGPFASLLRLFNGLSSLLRLAPLMRARSTPQLLIAGSLSAAATIREKWTAMRARSQIFTNAGLGISNTDLAQTNSILIGYCHDAQLDEMLEPQNAGDFETAIDEKIDRLTNSLNLTIDDAVGQTAEKRVARRAGWFTHLLLEVMFIAMPGFFLYQLGKNVFYEHPMQQMSLLGVDYVVHAVLWTLAWAWILRGFLLLRVGSGMRREVLQIATSAAESRSIITLLFSEIQQALQKIQQQIKQFQQLKQTHQQIVDTFGEIQTDGESTGRLKKKNKQ